MIKEIKKLKIYKQQLKDLIIVFEDQLLLLEKNKIKYLDKFKKLSKTISRTQDICDKINTLLSIMISSKNKD